MEVRRFIGELTIETGGVDRVEVSFDPGAHLLDAPDFDVDDGVLKARQLDRFARVSCRTRGDRLQVRIGRRGEYHDLADYGRLVIRAPAGADVAVGGGALIAEIGDVGDAAVAVDSCGDVSIDAVAGRADLAVNGSGSIETGTVGEALAAAINGSGDIETGAVDGGLDAAVNGSGDIHVAQVDGDVDAAIRGSGDIVIDAGAAPSLNAVIMGSGDVRFDGVAGSVDLASFGSGDVIVAEVTGDSDTAALGSGRVRIGRH